MILLWAVLWAIVTIAIAQSDGTCRGVCRGCVYEADCPQRKGPDMNATRKYLHTPWSDEIDLISFAPAGAEPGATVQDAQGYADVKEVKTSVYCTWEDGVSQKEFYLSYKEGLQASASVELWTVEYDGQEFVDFHGKRYRVLRSFVSAFDCTTLILAEVVR